MGGVDREVLHIMVGIEGDRDDLLFPQPIEDLEIVAFVVDQSRANDFGLVNVLVMVIVLDQIQDLAQASLRG